MPDLGFDLQTINFPLGGKRNLIFTKALREIIPVSFINYLKLLQCKRRFPKASYIRTYEIKKDVEIGFHVGIGEDVILDSNVKIGDFSYINKGTIIFSGSIGKFCSIAHYCQIGLPIHPLKYISTNPNTYGEGNFFGFKTHWEDIYNPPMIGNDVWIGSQAMIMQGVTIGHGAVIAAGAVVTKNVEPYEIVAGIPAKVIGYRFEKEKIEYLLDLKWWDLPGKEIENLKFLFENVVP